MKNFLKIVFFACIFLFDSIQAQEINFIHITDINLNVNNAYQLQRTIKEINATQNIDFVVFGGNNIAKTNIDNLNTFCYLLRRMRKQSIVLLGSTDVSSSTGIDKEYYIKKIRRALFYRHNSKQNYYFIKKGYVFVVMDGSKQYFQAANGYYTKQELRWLDNTLDKFKDKNVIILQHFPITIANSTWLQTAKIENYIEVLKKHNNVKVIINGHYGTNSEEKIGGIYNIITESYSKNNAYKIIKIDLDNDFIGTYLIK